MPKGSIEWEYDHEEGLVMRIKPAFPRLLANEAHSHFSQSRRDMLVAIRNLIDATLQSMDTKEKPSRKARTRIKVE